MSKVKNSTTLPLGITKPTAVKSSSTTTAIPVKSTGANSMATSFDAQCQIIDAQNISAINRQKELALNNQQQQVKQKKRTALENISNANSNVSNNVSTTSTVSNSNNTKKSRFGAASQVFQSIGGVTQSKKASTTTATTNVKDQAKENQTTKSKFQFGKQQQQQVIKPSIKPLSSSTNVLRKTQDNKPIEMVESKSLDQMTQSITMVSSSSSCNDIEILGSFDECINNNNVTQEKQTLSAEAALAPVNNTTNKQVELWEDIDAGDTDEFNAGDYVASIFNYYREREEQFSVCDYLKNQPHLNKQMRLLLVDWMVEVQQQLEFNHEVLYLSVKLLDMYLNSRRIEKEKLQLLGGAAMFIACKFEERMPPIIDDFIYVSDNAYDRKELIKMEIDILKTVQFDIGAPLSYTFLRRYSKCIKADMRFLTLARYILELSLQEYTFAYISDSLKACAALYLALKMTVKYETSIKEASSNSSGFQQQQHLPQLAVTTANLTDTEWNATLTHYTNANLDDFIQLVPQMNQLVQAAPASKYKTIFKKYSHQVFYEVAKVPCLSAADLESLIQNSAQISKTLIRK